jgi:hypothetical protein
VAAALEHLRGMLLAGDAGGATWANYHSLQAVHHARAGDPTQAVRAAARLVHSAPTDLAELVRLARLVMACGFGRAPADAAPGGASIFIDPLCP